MYYKCGKNTVDVLSGKLLGSVYSAATSKQRLTSFPCTSKPIPDTNSLLPKEISASQEFTPMETVNFTRTPSIAETSTVLEPWTYSQTIFLKSSYSLAPSAHRRKSSASRQMTSPVVLGNLNFRFPTGILVQLHFFFD